MWCSVQLLLVMVLLQLLLVVVLLQLLLVVLLVLLMLMLVLVMLLLLVLLMLLVLVLLVVLLLMVLLLVVLLVLLLLVVLVVLALALPPWICSVRLLAIFKASLDSSIVCAIRPFGAVFFSMMPLMMLVTRSRSTLAVSAFVMSLFGTLSLLSGAFATVSCVFRSRVPFSSSPLTFSIFFFWLSGTAFSSPVGSTGGFGLFAALMVVSASILRLEDRSSVSSSSFVLS